MFDLLCFSGEFLDSCLLLSAVAADQAEGGATEMRVSPPSGGSAASLSSGDLTLLKNDPENTFSLLPLKLSKLPTAARPPSGGPVSRDVTRLWETSFVCRFEGNF